MLVYVILKLPFIGAAILELLWMLLGRPQSLWGRLAASAVIALLFWVVFLWLRIGLHE